MNRSISVPASVAMALAVLQNPNAAPTDRARCADLIARAILKADDGLQRAAAILAEVAEGTVTVRTKTEAAKWLNGGAR